MVKNFELWVIRHGETVWGKLNIIQGQQDSSLTEIGIMQARTVAQKLIAIDAIISSDLGRAMMTASIIANYLHIEEIESSRYFRERCFGNLQGQSKIKHFSTGFDNNILFATAIGIEPLNMFYARIQKGLNLIETNYSGKRVVLLTHGGVIRYLYLFFMRLDISTAPYNMPIDNCSLHIF